MATQQLGIRIRKELYDKLRELAQEQERSVRDILEEAMIYGLPDVEHHGKVRKEMIQKGIKPRNVYKS